MAPGSPWREQIKSIRGAIRVVLIDNGFASGKREFRRDGSGICQIVTIGQGTWDPVVQVTAGICLISCEHRQNSNLHIFADAQALLDERDRIKWREAMLFQSSLTPDERHTVIRAGLELHILPWLEEFSSMDVIRQRFAGYHDLNQRRGLITLEGRRLLGLPEPGKSQD